jgi:signal transduction histidine kinase
VTEQPIFINVQPPWWATWWFRGLLPLLILGAVIGGYWWRLHSIQTRSQELAVQVAERTTELSALYTLTTVVSSTLDLQETLTAALDTTLELTACDAGGIHLLQGQTARLELMNGCCLSQETLNSLEHLATTDSFLETAVQTGAPNVRIDLSSLPTIPFQSDGFNWLAVIPLTARGAVLGTLFIVKQNTQGFSAPDSELLASIGNQIGVAIENARLFAAEQSRAEQFQLISEVSYRFTSILDIKQVLAEVVRLVQQTYGHYHVAIGLIEGDEVVYRTGAGPLWENPEFEFQPSRLKVGQEGLSGWVAGSGRPLIVPDVTQEPRYILMQGSAARSELTVPLKIKEQVIGVLDVQSDQLDDFDETDLVVMQLLAGQAAIAIENARLYEQARQLAVVEERNRLARDLHDSVTQSIYSLTLLAEAGQRMIQAGDTAVIQQNQERLGAIAQQALQEMRLLVYELRPLDLTQTGLVAAIEHRLEVVERRAGVDVNLSILGAVCLPAAVEEALYRIVQEALNNALKHAQATAVSVTIQAMPDTIMLEIQDNGRGFETVLAERMGGLGLISMRERAQKLHGRFAITSTLGNGTTVCAEIPLAIDKEMAITKEMPISGAYHDE